MTVSTKGTVCEEVEKCVNVFWLREEISQSYERESKACTLIALQFLENYKEANLNFLPNCLSDDLIAVFDRSIKEGNKIYATLYYSGMLKEKYLNIPEGLIAVRKKNDLRLVEWRSFFYDTPITETLFYNLKENLKKWEHCKPRDASSDICVVLIANLRAVAIVSTRRPNVVTLLDSHAHCPYGGVIAISPISCLESLCRWYAAQLTKDTRPNPVTCYELTFIYHRKQSKPTLSSTGCLDHGVTH